MYDADYDAQTLITSVQTAILGAVAIPSGDAPTIEGIVPLLLDDSPAFTLPYDRLETARQIDRADITLALHDPRLSRTGWSPLSVPVQAAVEADPDGDIFRETLMEQELRKHPPSREIINSFLLQRENWWYLPRLIVHLKPTETPRPLARREDSTHGLLAWPGDTHPAVQTVAVPDTSGERFAVRSLGAGDPPDGAHATLRLHDLEIPEMERSTTLNLSGHLRGGNLTVETRIGSAELGPRPGIVSRWRWFKSLERNCKRGLKTGYE